MRNNLFAVENCEFEENFSLDSLELGSVIAKGSSAVVYEAREKSKTGTFLHLLISHNVHLMFQ